MVLSSRLVFGPTNILRLASYVKRSIPNTREKLNVLFVQKLRLCLCVVATLLEFIVGYYRPRFKYARYAHAHTMRRGLVVIDTLSANLEQEI